MNDGFLPLLRIWSLYALGLLLGIALIVAALLALIKLFAVPQRPLSEQLVGSVGKAVTEISSREGKIDLDGRTVRAVAEERITAGALVKVLRVDGFVAKVTPLDTPA